MMDFGFSQVIARQVAHLSHKSPNSAYIDETDFIDLPEGWAGIVQVHAISRKIFRQIAFVVFGLLVIIRECVFPFGRILPERTVSTTLAWYFLGGAALLALAARPYQAVLEGIGKLYASNLILGSYQLVTTVTLIVVARQVPDMAWMGLTVFGLAGLQLEAFRRAFYSFTKIAPGRSNSRCPGPGLARQIRKIAAPIGIVNLAAMMVSSIQVPLLGFLLGPVKVTGFFLAQKMSQSMNLAVLQFAFSQLPLFTQELGSGRIADARRRLMRNVMLSHGLVSAGAMSFYLLSPFVVELTLGHREYITRKLLGLLALDQLLLGWCVVWSRFVIAAGRNPFLPSTLIGGALNLALCIILIKRFGLVGLASAGLISGLCTHYWFNVWKGLELAHKLKMCMSRE